MSNQKRIKITAEQGAPRLDLFLSEQLKITRSQAQKLIEQRRIRLNGQEPKKMGEKVRMGDEITVVPQSSNLTILQSSPVRPTKIRRLEDLKITIVAAAPDYLVVEKPAGLLTHPTQANETNTLVNYLIKKYSEIKKVGDPAPRLRSGQNVRPGIVHRLDKEASGLLVVARTQKMFNHLKGQFKNRTIEKEYWALVHGRVAKDWDILTFPIARSSTSDRMAARPLSSPARGEVVAPRQPEGRESEDGAKAAQTEFLVERRFVNFTLLRITLHTGRMHQIRVHLLAYNHPLVGDPLYFQKKRKRMWDEKLGRLFLHSTRLSFTDLEGQRQTFESLLPDELKNFLKLLK